LLAQHGIAFTAREIFHQPLTTDEIRALAAYASVTALFSWRSPTARKQGLTPGAVDDEALIDLMVKEPRLIRRPLMLVGERLVIGADAGAIARFAAAG